MGKILYANGCSWTAGNGLAQDPLLSGKADGPSDLKFSKDFAWPGVLGRKLSYGVINDAMGGGSNKRILRTTTDYVMNFPAEERKNLLVVIGWTSIERGEVHLHNGGHPDWFRFNARQQFSKSHQNIRDPIMAEDVDRYQQIYLTHMHDRKINMMYYFQEVFLLSNLLENLKIKYMFFNGVLTEFNRTPEEEAEYQREVNKIRKPSIITDTSFSAFCAENNIPLSPCIHPMTVGHHEWAKFLFTRLNALYWREL